MGAIMWNHKGEMFVTMACKGQGVVVAIIAKACNLCMALQWAHDLTFRRILSKTNCISLVTAIIMNFSLQIQASVLSYWTVECDGFFCALLSQPYHHEGNVVAHELAKRALQAKANKYWIEVLVDIVHLVIEDHNDSWYVFFLFYSIQ